MDVIKNTLIAFLIIFFPAITLAANSGGTHCSFNSEANPYKLPFTCEHKQNLTTSSVQTIVFKNTTPRSQCKIVAKKPQTIVLIKHDGCQKQFPRTVSKNVILHAGSNTLNINNHCYADDSYNHASFYIENSVPQQSILVYCSATTDA